MARHKTTINKQVKERQEVSERAATLRSQKTDIEAQKAQLAAQLTKVKSEPDKMKKQADVVMAAAQSLESEAAKLESAVALLDNELANQGRKRKELEARLNEWFQKFDTDKSGDLNRHELKQLLVHAHPDAPEPSEEMLDMLIERATAVESGSRCNRPLPRDSAPTVVGTAWPGTPLV